MIMTITYLENSDAETHLATTENGSEKIPTCFIYEVEVSDRLNCFLLKITAVLCLRKFFLAILTAWFVQIFFYDTQATYFSNIKCLLINTQK